MFTNQNIIDYYNQTEIHYRKFWKLDKALGLHYGFWETKTKKLSDAIINLNKQLAQLGEIKPSSLVLDAGCGLGGSGFYLAKHQNCNTIGITLSQKQVDKATLLAKVKGLSDKCEFIATDYLGTPFNENTFDYVLAIESFGSATDKSKFFAEMKRVLKPGGKILMADTLKPYPFDINQAKALKTMLNGWVISDILSIDQVKKTALINGFTLKKEVDANLKVKKSVNRMYWASVLGMPASVIYNMFFQSSTFSKHHYKTGLAQKRANKMNQWRYYLLVFELTK